MSRLLSGPAGLMIKSGLALGAVGMAVDNLLFNVPPGYRGIVFDRLQGGIQQKVYEEGTHLIMPGIQQPKLMDVRTSHMTLSSTTGTKDLQKVALSLRVLSRPRIDALPKIYKELGTDYQRLIQESIGNEVLKSVVAQYNAKEMLTLRDQVSKKIREGLTERAADFNILLDDVSITHLGFSNDFSRAIESKQVAEQMAERAKFVVMKAEQERQALIIRSEGDAEAAKLVSDSIQQSGRGYIELRRIETASEIATTLAKSRGNVTYLPSSENGGSNMLLNLPAGGRK